MPKLFTRITALIVISALLGGDPSWAAFATPFQPVTSTQVSLNHRSLYSEQALIAMGVIGWHVAHHPLSAQLAHDLGIFALGAGATGGLFWWFGIRPKQKYEFQLRKNNEKLKQALSDLEAKIQDLSEKNTWAQERINVLAGMVQRLARTAQDGKIESAIRDIRFISVFTDFYKNYLTLLKEAHTDPLTQIGNRMFFNKVMGKALEMAKTSETPLSVIMFDADFFKDFNENRTYRRVQNNGQLQSGHQVGDHVLRYLAHAAKELVRGYDIVTELSEDTVDVSEQATRLGGEEFVIVLPNTLPEDAARVAERLREAVLTGLNPFTGKALSPLEKDNDDIQTTLKIIRAHRAIAITLGVATWDGQENAEDFLQRADSALDQGKKTGRNKVVVASSVRTESQPAPALSPALAGGIHENATPPVTQPKTYEQGLKALQEWIDLWNETYPEYGPLRAEWELKSWKSNISVKEPDGQEASSIVYTRNDTGIISSNRNTAHLYTRKRLNTLLQLFLLYYYKAEQSDHLDLGDDGGSFSQGLEKLGIYSHFEMGAEMGTVDTEWVQRLAGDRELLRRFIAKDRTLDKRVILSDTASPARWTHSRIAAVLSALGGTGALFHPALAPYAPYILQTSLLFAAQAFSLWVGKKIFDTLKASDIEKGIPVVEKDEDIVAMRRGRRVWHSKIEGSVNAETYKNLYTPTDLTHESWHWLSRSDLVAYLGQLLLLGSFLMGLTTLLPAPVKFLVPFVILPILIWRFAKAGIELPYAFNPKKQVKGERLKANEKEERRTLRTTRKSGRVVLGLIGLSMLSTLLGASSPPPLKTTEPSAKNPSVTVAHSARAPSWSQEAFQSVIKSMVDAEHPWKNDARDAAQTARFVHKLSGQDENASDERDIAQAIQEDGFDVSAYQAAMTGIEEQLNSHNPQERENLLWETVSEIASKTTGKKTDLGAAFRNAARTESSDALKPLAIASIENIHFKTNSVSEANAKGLMQLMPWLTSEVRDPLTGKILPALKDPLDPQANIQRGTWYLQYLEKRYEKGSAYHLTRRNAQGKRTLVSIRIAKEDVPMFVFAAYYLGEPGLNVGFYDARLKSGDPSRVVSFQDLVDLAENDPGHYPNLLEGVRYAQRATRFYRLHQTTIDPQPAESKNDSSLPLVVGMAGLPKGRTKKTLKGLFSRVQGWFGERRQKPSQAAEEAIEDPVVESSLESDEPQAPQPSFEEPVKHSNEPMNDEEIQDALDDIFEVDPDMQTRLAYLRPKKGEIPWRQIQADLETAFGAPLTIPLIIILAWRLERLSPPEAKILFAIHKPEELQEVRDKRAKAVALLKAKGLERLQTELFWIPRFIRQRGQTPEAASFLVNQLPLPLPRPEGLSDESRIPTAYQKALDNWLDLWPGTVKLTDREREYWDHFETSGDNNSEIAEKMGITPERVRQLSISLVKKMRHAAARFLPKNPQKNPLLWWENIVPTIAITALASIIAHTSLPLALGGSVTAVVLHEFGHTIFSPRFLRSIHWGEDGIYVQTWKSPIAALMGPLPGLVLGMGLILTHHTSSGLPFLLMNALSLIPTRRWTGHASDGDQLGIPKALKSFYAAA